MKVTFKCSPQEFKELFGIDKIEQNMQELIKPYIPEGNPWTNPWTNPLVSHVFGTTQMDCVSETTGAP